MKKLLYITTNIQNSGGVSRILSVKLNYLIEAYNYDISIINSNQVNYEFFYSFNSKIKFYCINSKNFFKYKSELNFLVKKLSPDIIINCDNGLKGSLLTYLIGSKTPLIYERHCSKSINVRTLKERLKLQLSNILMQLSIKKYNHFIVLNEEDKRDWISNNIKIIPNPSWVKISNKIFKKDDNVVIAVGRHSYEKGYDKLIEIWKLVVKENPDLILKIYGEQNEDIPLNKIIIQERLEKNIQIYNPVNDIEKIFSRSSILLSTSNSESFPLVIIEAMSFGIPVIGFDKASGIKAIIENGKNGFLIKYNDINDYVEKINHIINDVSLRNQMGNYARNSVKKYNLEAIMNEWHELFKSLN